jgi:hypothetical protein
VSQRWGGNRGAITAPGGGDQRKRNDCGHAGNQRQGTAHGKVRLENAIGRERHERGAEAHANQVDGKEIEGLPAELVGVMA